MSKPEASKLVGLRPEKEPVHGRQCAKPFGLIKRAAAISVKAVAWTLVLGSASRIFEFPKGGLP